MKAAAGALILAMLVVAPAFAAPRTDEVPPKTVSPLTVTPQPRDPPPVDARVTLASGEEDLDNEGATISRRTPGIAAPAAGRCSPA